MADPFVAEIRIFPFNFAPKGWAFCDGQLLPLSQNTALFSLLGTTYGGDGKSNFALPDMQGNAPMHPGQGPGLSLHDLGETGGSETVIAARIGNSGAFAYHDGIECAMSRHVTSPVANLLAARHRRHTFYGAATAPGVAQSERRSRPPAATSRTTT